MTPSIAASDATKTNQQPTNIYIDIDIDEDFELTAPAPITHTPQKNDSHNGALVWWISTFFVCLLVRPFLTRQSFCVVVILSKGLVSLLRSVFPGSYGCFYCITNLCLSSG